MVRDMNRAVNFYKRTLGLKAKARYGDEFAQVEAPGTIIALHPPGRRASLAPSSETPSIGFGVDDLDETMAELRGRGVEFSKVSDDGHVRLAFFADPDGTPLYLSQTRWP